MYAEIKFSSLAEFSAEPQANSMHKCVLSGVMQRMFYDNFANKNFGIRMANDKHNGNT